MTTPSNEPTSEDNSMTPVQAASRIIWGSLAESAKLAPREQAEAAYYVGGPSVDELEQLILKDRGLTTDPDWGKRQPLPQAYRAGMTDDQTQPANDTFGPDLLTHYRTELNKIPKLRAPEFSISSNSDRDTAHQIASHVMFLTGMVDVLIQRVLKLEADAAAAEPED